jgi:hypothetical protein
MHNNFSRLSLPVSLSLSLSLSFPFADDDEDVRRGAYTYLCIYTTKERERDDCCCCCRSSSHHHHHHHHMLALGVIDSFSFFSLFIIDFGKKTRQLVSLADAKMFFTFDEENTRID